MKSENFFEDSYLSYSWIINKKYIYSNKTWILFLKVIEVS